MQGVAQAASRRAVLVGVGLVTWSVLISGACSDSGGWSGSETEEQGRAVAADAGCGSCHGRDGQGGVGPAWVGLAGSEVTLESGEMVIADSDYLRRSIAEPDAQVVAGFNVKMPTTTLTEGEIDAVVAYIQALE